MTRTEALAAHLRELLAAGEQLKRSIEEVRVLIAPHMPLSPEDIEQLPASARIAADAFLLRFANLTMLVHDPLLRSILLAEKETLDGRSRRDALNLAAKLGALRPDVDPDSILGARHRLAHVYPNDPARQASLVNQIFDTAPMLVAMYDGLSEYALRRGLTAGAA